MMPIFSGVFRRMTNKQSAMFKTRFTSS